MTQFDLQVLLDALAQQCPVRPSDRIEDAVDIGVNDTLVSVQWSDETSWMELTVALPPVIDPDEQPEALLPLYRALLERHWTQWGGEDGLSFGLLPSTNEVVAMATLDGDAFTGPDGFMAALQQVAVSALAEWYGICAPLLLQHSEGQPAPPADPLHPAGPSAVSA